MSRPQHSQFLTTPFHSRTAALCRTGQWSRWSGYTTVQVYDSVELEHSATRNTATLFDLSPICKYRISGRDAERFLNRLVTRDVRRLAPGRVAYAVWCDDDGMVIDDGTVFRLTGNDFRLMSQERQLPWLLDSAIGFEVDIEDVSEGTAALALQGPTSCAILKAAGCAGIDGLRPFAVADFRLDGAAATISRTGYTGDLGYELWLSPADAGAVWDLLMDAGGLHGLRPMGSLALDLTRIEAGFLQANVDFVAGGRSLRPGRLRSPFELGLERLVDFGKGHFSGRRALLAEKERGTSRYRFVVLDVDGRKPAHHALLYDRRGREAGMVTSAAWSPVCKRNIALASLHRSVDVDGGGLWADIYVQRELRWDRIKAPCRIVERPFYAPAWRRATPAPDR
jgi:aminomethyltransferase